MRDIAIATTCRRIACATRLRLMQHLQDNGEATPSELTDSFAMTPGTIVTHLQLLQRDGLVIGDSRDARREECLQSLATLVKIILSSRFSEPDRKRKRARHSHCDDLPNDCLRDPAAIDAASAGRRRGHTFGTCGLPRDATWHNRHHRQLLQRDGLVIGDPRGVRSGIWLKFGNSCNLCTQE